MGKDNVRTLKNFNGKKSSKKNSKSRKNRNGPSTTEEMRDFLNTESDMPMNNKHNFMSKNNNKGLIQYEGDVPSYGGMNGPMGMSQMGMPQMGMPQMGMPQMGMPQMGMPQMNVPNMGMQQMFSPANYDPLMLQQIAPLQTTSVMQQSGMPSNLMSPSGMASGMAGFAHAGAPSIPQFSMQQGPPQLPSMHSMVGGGYRSIPQKRLILTRTIL
jgi:hypothetical protein